MFPVPTLIAVPVMPVPVVVIGGAPDGGNTQQQVQPIQPVGPVGPLGPLGPWNPAGMTGDAAWGPWNYGSGNWADGQNDWTSGHAAPEAWGQGQNAWQNGGNGGGAAKDLLDVAYDYQVDSVRALVQLLQDVLADKSAEKEYGQGKNPPCHRYALPDEGAKMLLRWLNDTAAKACWAMEPFAVEDRFKPVPSGRLTKTMERLVAQITSACEAKERCVMRAQLLSSLTKALICLVDSTVYTIKTPAKTIEALIPMLERYRPKYVRAVREFQCLQMLSLQKIAEAIDILVQRKPRATRATAKRDGEQIRGNVDWIARTLMSLKGCSWSRNPSMAYKEFLQRLNVSQESISRVMNHAQFYVWNKMQYFWTEAAKEKTRLQWIRYQKAMQAALQGSSVSSTETEDASAGDWFHAEEPAEAMNGEEGHSEWLEPSFASEDVSAKAATYDWAETDAKKDRSDSNAAEAFRWCNQPVEGMTEHGNGQMESQTNEAFCWWNQPMEGMTEHRNGQMESQTNEAPAWCTVPMTEEGKEHGWNKGTEDCQDCQDFQRRTTASTEATAKEEDQTNGEVVQPARRRWVDIVEDEDDEDGIWTRPPAPRVYIKDT